MKGKSWIGWRKLSFAILLTALSTIFMFIGLAKFDQWAEFQKWIYLSYSATNVGEYLGKRFVLKDEIKIKKEDK
jgi:hypothetical protein